MSVQMMGAVIACGPQDRTQFCVLLAMANYADDFGFAYPSQATLSADSRCDERTTRRQLDDLESSGWLYIARKILNGKSNVYMLNLERLGVTAPGDGRRNPLFLRLLKKSPDTMTPIFGAKRAVPGPAPTDKPAAVENPVEDPMEDATDAEESADTAEFSGDNPQPLQRTNAESHRTKEGGSPDTACPPNRYNRHSLNRQGTFNGVEPDPPYPPGGDSDSETSNSPPGVVRLPATKPEWYQQRWRSVLHALKLDLGGVRSNFKRVRRDMSDWDACFAFAGLADIVFTADEVRLKLRLGDAVPGADEAATRLGLVKYEKRLVRLVREYFNVPALWAIRFELEPMQPSAEVSHVA